MKQSNSKRRQVIVGKLKKQLQFEKLKTNS